MAGKKQAPKQQFTEMAEEPEAESWDGGAEVDTSVPDELAQPQRDWRDVEKYREMRELRRLVGDEFDFTEVLGEIRVRVRSQNGAAPPKIRPVAAAAPVIRPAKSAAPAAKPAVRLAPKSKQTPARKKSAPRPIRKLPRKRKPKPATKRPPRRAARTTRKKNAAKSKARKR